MISVIKIYLYSIGDVENVLKDIDNATNLKLISFNLHL